MSHIYASVSSVLIRMLQVFSSGRCNVCNGYTRVFKFFLLFCKCFNCFDRMLQVFLLNVAKVDRMFHMLIGTHLPQPPAAAAGAPPSGQTVLMCSRAAQERATRAPHGHAKQAGMGNGVQGNSTRAGPDVRPLASSYVEIVRLLERNEVISWLGYTYHTIVHDIVQSRQCTHNRKKLFRVNT
jgi:hypothetical protein